MKNFQENSDGGNFTYGQRKIHEFLEELAKEVPPLPAGGCAVALAGAISAAMETFVARLTLSRHKGPDVPERLEGIISPLESLQEECTALMERDVEAYGRIIQASKMAKRSQEEEAKRKSALEEAKIGALSPPMTLIECSLKMLRYSHMLVEEGCDVALADAAVAVEMAHATFWGALWIAKANLTGISDLGFVDQHQRLLKKIQTEAQDLYQKIQERLDERF